MWTCVTDRGERRAHDVTPLSPSPQHNERPRVPGREGAARGATVSFALLHAIWSIFQRQNRRSSLPDVRERRPELRQHFDDTTMDCWTPRPNPWQVGFVGAHVVRRSNLPPTLRASRRTQRSVVEDGGLAATNGQGWLCNVPMATFKSRSAARAVPSAPSLRP